MKCKIWVFMDYRQILNDTKLLNYYEKIIGIYTLSSYDNLKNIEYLNHFNLLQKEGIARFLSGEPLFNCINRVAIMLSNLCNYACLHKECPANQIQKKEIMPSKTVYKIIDELHDSKFQGEIYFHIYNEPLIDPRLFMFIQYCKKLMPDINIQIYSNGYYFDETMIYELEAIGVTRITTTAYSKNEWSRLTSYKPNVAFHVLKGNLDQRLDLYTNSENAKCSRQCTSYFDLVPIYVNGDIGACCLDWKHTYDIGNVNKSSLEEIINSKTISNFQRELLLGNRSVFPICKNCEWY